MRPLTLVVLLTALLGVPTDTDRCSGSAAWGGACNVSNSGTSVDISGSTGAGKDKSSQGSADRDESDDRGGNTSVPAPECVGALCYRIPITYEVGILRPTLTDVASFAPAGLGLTDEPDGVGIVGMPVNFVVTATTHEQTGELFDLPVTVRFTPDSVVFAYGDGVTRTAADGGRSLSALGLPQFSATPTSHAYAARGTYTASALVRYAAEVDFGSGWVPVPGLLAIPTANATIDVLEARTALVDRTCIEDPAGVGC